MPHKLAFSSPTFAFRLLGLDEPASVIHDGWVMEERFQPDTAMRGTDSYGTYGIVIEHSVATLDELSELEMAGVHLLEEIERLWAFVAGLPLRSNGFGVHLSPLEPPKGWSSNARDIDERMQEESEELIVGSLTLSTIHWRSAKNFPLRALQSALTAWQTADSMTKGIVALHYDAVMTPTRDGPHVLLAKALEMVRPLLPGRSDEVKQRSLPPSVLSSMTHDLHSLYHLANNRLNTRHPITRDAVPSLQPSMTGQEGLTFLREADAIVRSVVCARLGLDMVVIHY